MVHCTGKVLRLFLVGTSWNVFFPLRERYHVDMASPPPVRPHDIGGTLQDSKNSLSPEAALDLRELMISLLRESERAVVIIAAARLDAGLEAILKHVLIPHPGGTDPLFDGDRMLGTFSAKIAMAHRIGAIDNDFEHALQILRKIRNDFAHDLETESLASTRQKQRLSILVRWANNSATFGELAGISFSGKRSNEHTQFVCCTVIMVAMLAIGTHRLTRVVVGKPLSMTGVGTASNAGSNT
jgi:hypothetical protein